MPELGHVGASLSKKVGPLKAWQWGAVLGGGYLLYRVMKGKGISLTGSTAATTDATGTTGTSVGGSGVVPDTSIASSAPPPTVVVSIQPESVQPTAPSIGGMPGGSIIPDTPVIHLPDQSAALKKAQANVVAQHTWGEHWKQQSFKNAANASRASGKIPATRKVATAATYKPTPVVQHPAKRTIAPKATINPAMAEKKMHNPAPKPKRTGGIVNG